VALFVALGGGAYAASGGFVGKDGRIHGCVKGDGGLRVVKSGKGCSPGQQALAWNQKGPRGRQGSRGLRGLQGPAGPGAVRIHREPTAKALNIPLYDAHGLVLKGFCNPEGPEEVDIGVDTRVQATANVIEVKGTTIERHGAGGPGGPSATPNRIETVGAVSGGAIDGQIVYDNANATITVQYHLFVDNTGCQIYGTVLPTT
jgi:hypothetical protein